MYENYVVFFILLTLETLITFIIVWTHYVTAMSNPGYENRIFELLDCDESLN